MRWPVSACMAAVGVAACRMPAAAARTVSSRSCASVQQLRDLFDPDPGDVAHAPAHRVDHAGLVGQLHHELVDRHARLTLEHLEPDDVALHRPDLGRHGAEDTRGVGQPDAHPGQHGTGSVPGPAQWVRVMRTTTRMVFSALPA